MNYKRLISYLLIIVISYVTIDKFSITYSFEDYKEFCSVLINVASMVFTIMGIWIAFLYPNALSRIVNPNIKTADFTESLKETTRLEALVASVLKSALVMLFILFVYFIKIFLFKTSFYFENSVLLKQLALSATVMIAYLQIEAVLNVIFSNVAFLYDLHSKREQREGDADI